MRSVLVVVLAALLGACGAPATSPSAPAAATATAPASPTRICDGGPDGETECLATGLS